MHAHAFPASGDYLLLVLASLAGSGHCVGMCGPYVACCSTRIAPLNATASQRRLLRALFNAGRLCTYALIGLLAGAFGRIALAAGVGGVLGLLAGLAAIVFGLSLLGLIRDPAGALVRSGLGVVFQESTRVAILRPPYLAALLLGSLQGALPCALVYGAASRAVVAGSAASGAVMMLVFGLGTVPAVVGLTLIPHAVLVRVRTWRWAGVFITAVGLLLLFRGVFGLNTLTQTP